MLVQLQGWLGEGHTLHGEGQTLQQMLCREPSFPLLFRYNLPGSTLLLGIETTYKCQHNAAGFLKQSNSAAGGRANPHKSKRLAEEMAELCWQESVPQG